MVRWATSLKILNVVRGVQPKKVRGDLSGMIASFSKWVSGCTTSNASTAVGVSRWVGKDGWYSNDDSK